jgi:hypothetical protein
MRRIAERGKKGESTATRQRFRDDADLAEQQAALLREAVTEYAARGLSVLIDPEDVR